MGKKNILALEFGGDFIYVILVYDIVADEEGAKVSRNIYKITKRYLYPVQKSVFEGNLSELNFQKLKHELNKYIRKDRDSLIIFISRDEKWLNKQFLGVEDDNTNNIF
ncbi:MAG TPA: CRISPR-associated endonuclease Cas2 [Soehngenia sp.]|nr:CRISPR-associated endonuclease Cas2 [Soehngenia sp.]